MKTFAVFILFLLTSATLATEVPKLSELSVQLAPRESLPLAPTISLEVVTRTSNKVAEQFAQFNGITVTSISDNSVTITLDERPHYIAPVTEDLTQNSFVIDFEEQSVVDFVDEFKQTTSKKTPWQDLPIFVSEFINQPTYIHGFNIASIVAKDRSGDCTEYAVLTSALARAMGLPSRVVFGSVIVENNNNLEAFGHAWSEVWQDNQWNIADAAMVNAEATKLFYLPSGVLENEGPGYTLSIMGAVRFLPDEIRDVKSVSDAQ